MTLSNKPPALSDLDLPIVAVAGDVCDRLQQGNVVLQAQPGAGKSTGLPLALLTADFEGKILLLEPRRLAARGVAARLAWHLGEPVGQTIGLRMRGLTQVSIHTRLEVVTEGVLTRILQNDPLLEGVSVIVFDEFHERSLHADLGLALCLDVQQSVRDDLRLLLMSATLDGAGLSSHINAGAPVVCEVRQHPVEIHWHSDRFQSLPAAVAVVVTEALNNHAGDVLVFLPGVAEIEKTAKALDQRLPKNTVLHRLHSGINSSAQQAATSPAEPGAPRRVILSTSLAETSITIDGVCVVIDSGLERRQRIDRNSGAERLETVTASRASATQRAGRAGRTQAGVCYRLWSEASHATRSESWQPEILRAELSSLVSDLGMWGVSDINSLPWIDAPPATSIAGATNLLTTLGAWSDTGFTRYGRKVAALPVHPRHGHMLLWGAQSGWAKAACNLTAVLEDLPRIGGCDFSSVLSRLSKSQQRRSQQLLQLLDVSNSKAKPEDTKAFDYAVLLARAFPDRIARRRASAEGRYLLSSGAGAVIHTEDSLAQDQWLAVARLGGSGNEARIFAALPLTLRSIEQWCEDLIDVHESVEWDDRNEKVLAERQTRLGRIILHAKPLQKITPEQRQLALLAAIKKRGLQCLDWNTDVIEWQARVTRIREHHEDFPIVDDKHLLNTLDSWLLPFVGKAGTLAALKRLDVLTALSSLLNYAQQQQLEKMLPRRYTVPSGNSHKLRYACEGNPVLAVKLQEMFGCHENPSVANGKIPLKVELLSPAHRPVQITEDLANFWTNSYPAVKKDLAGRYPKHPWPDDPLNTPATVRAKPRKR